MSELLKGKRRLVMGVANERSSAWGIAQALHGAGAELAFTYQGEAFGKRLEPLQPNLHLVRGITFSSHQSRCQVQVTRVHGDICGALTT